MGNKADLYAQGTCSQCVQIGLLIELLKDVVSFRKRPEAEPGSKSSSCMQASSIGSCGQKLGGMYSLMPSTSYKKQKPGGERSVLGDDPCV